MVVCDVLFSVAHSNQGRTGVLLKPIGCFYFRFVLLRYGLIAAMYAHALWDAILMFGPFVVSSHVSVLKGLWRVVS